MKSRALLPASDEMQEWCSILEQEMVRWPGVKVSHVFGTLAFHHRKVMFAMLPGNRSLDETTAISFRVPTGVGAIKSVDWQTFELTNPDHLGKALSLLDKAYKESVLHPFSDLQKSLQGRGQ
jgi:hypothetical protein